MTGPRRSFIAAAFLAATALLLAAVALPLAAGHPVSDQPRPRAQLALEVEGAPFLVPAIGSVDVPLTVVNYGSDREEVRIAFFPPQDGIRVLALPMYLSLEAGESRTFNVLVFSSFDVAPGLQTLRVEAYRYDEAAPAALAEVQLDVERGFTLEPRVPTLQQPRPVECCEPVDIEFRIGEAPLPGHPIRLAPMAPPTPPLIPLPVKPLRAEPIHVEPVAIPTVTAVSPPSPVPAFGLGVVGVIAFPFFLWFNLFLGGSR